MLQTSSQRNKVNRELQRLGFGNLKDPRLHLQFAAVIRDHAHFRGILMHIPEGLDRKQWYEALAPNVRFKAKPLADYEMESKQLAEQNQLPTYDPKTLEAKEFKPQEFKTQRDDVICELCEANHAVTGDGKWHHYGTPEQCVCATSRFVPDGYNLAPYRMKPTWPTVDEVADKLATVAEEAINRDLREGQAKVQNTLICHKCTKQQKFRMKYRSSLFKLAAEAGWLIDNLKAFCPDCKARIN